MKKFHFTALLLLVSILAKAQFFHHRYYDNTTPYTTGWLFSGLNTKILSPGHFMAGTSGVGGGNSQEIIATYTDPDGNIPGAPYFNNIYSISPGNGGNALFIQSFEYNGGFGIVGIYEDIAGSPYKMFYLLLNSSGNIVAKMQYTSNFPGETLARVGITKSASGNELYITSGVQTKPPTAYYQYPFVMKIDIATGNIIWSHIYNIGRMGGGWGIVESPYSPSGVPEVVVAGYAYTSVGVPSDAMLLHLNANTGSSISPWPSFYGTSSTDDYFTCIKVANSPLGGSNGFIIGGNSGTSSSNDVWLLKVDPTGGIIWSNTYNYKQGTGILFDVIERQNTTGNYEYYAGGGWGTGTTARAMVLKTDGMGATMPGQLFLYGSNSDNEDCYALDQYTGTAHDGLSIYATGGDPITNNSYMTHIKAYFNGVSGCDENFQTAISNLGPGTYGEGSINVIDYMVASSINITGPTPANDATVCYTSDPPGLPGGNNARTVLVNESNATSLSPNPANRDDKFVSIKIYSQTDDNAQVYIYDLSGRSLLNKTYSLVEGNNSIQLDLSELNLAAGIYNVSIKRASENEYLKLSVE